MDVKSFNPPLLETVALQLSSRQFFFFLQSMNITSDVQVWTPFSLMDFIWNKKRSRFLLLFLSAAAAAAFLSSLTHVLVCVHVWTMCAWLHGYVCVFVAVRAQLQLTRVCHSSLPAALKSLWALRLICLFSKDGKPAGVTEDGQTPAAREGSNCLLFNSRVVSPVLKSLDGLTCFWNHC